MSEKDLDKEWKNYALQINLKIEDAVRALKDIEKLRQKANLPVLIVDAETRYQMSEQHSGDDDSENNYDNELEALEDKCNDVDFYPLEKALYEAGWRSSSDVCG